MDFCLSCQKFSLHRFSRAPDQACPFKLSAIEQGAREGCALCSFFSQQIQPILISFEVHPSKCWMRLVIPRRSDIDTDRTSGLGLSEIEVYLVNHPLETKTEQRSQSIFLGLAATPTSDSPAARNQDVVGRYYGEDLSSNDHTSANLEWLSSCLSHPQCSMTASGATRIDARDVLLPTRCVDVMQKHVCLRDTTGTFGSYVTLSHRWGKETEESKTTTSNLERRIDGRDLGGLPQIFNDAISITKSLGIRYVWIDSLCIIQSGDNGADWAKEAANMARYYQNSMVTISAPGSTPSKGMLPPRSEDSFRFLLRLPYRNTRGVQEGYFYIYQPRRRSSQAFFKDVRQSELLSRGWIFQEWFLSRRMIYYTPKEVFFECQRGSPQNERQQRMIVPHEHDVALRTQFRSPGYDSWYSVVESYSRTKLTRPDKDHLVALSGIAQEFREAIKINTKTPMRKTLKYLAGLWLDDLHHGLVWHTKRQEQKACNCGAPSWSWASQSGEIRWLQRASNVRKELQFVSVASTSGVHSVPELDLWPPLEVRTPSDSEAATASDSALRVVEQVPNSDLADLMSSDCAIVVKGRTQLVHINNNNGLASNGARCRKELNFGTVDILARETGVQLPEDYDLWKNDPDCQRAGDWRFVCSLSTPDVVGGWALFEDSDLVERLSSYDGFSALALHIFTRRKVALGRRVKGEGERLSWSHDVYDVLFLEPQGGDVFRRLGVGRIVDKQIMKDFAASLDQELKLV